MSFEGYPMHDHLHVRAFTEFGLGVCAHHKRQYQTALKHFTNAIHRNPCYVEAYMNRGVTYADMGSHREAIQNYHQAIQLSPGHALSYYNLGNAYRELGDYAPAAGAYRMAIEYGLNRDELTDAYTNLGSTYLRQHDHVKAIEAWTTAIDVKPSNGVPYFNRGETYLHLQKWEPALADLEAAAARGIDIPEAFQKVYPNVIAFEIIHGVTLPGPLAVMLTAQ